jgi:hypothetical protein
MFKRKRLLFRIRKQQRLKKVAENYKNEENIKELR